MRPLSVVRAVLGPLVSFSAAAVSAVALPSAGLAVASAFVLVGVVWVVVEILAARAQHVADAQNSAAQAELRIEVASLREAFSGLSDRLLAADKPQDGPGFDQGPAAPGSLKERVILFADRLERFTREKADKIPPPSEGRARDYFAGSMALQYLREFAREGEALADELSAKGLPLPLPSKTVRMAGTGIPLLRIVAAHFRDRAARLRNDE